MISQLALDCVGKNDGAVELEVDVELDWRLEVVLDFSTCKSHTFNRVI